MNLILFEQNEITVDLRVRLPVNDNRAVHIITILKAREGDSLDAGIVNGKKGIALIKSITNKEIIFLLEMKSEPKELHPLTLIMGLSRPPTIKKVLKEASALGVKQFIFCGTENGEKSYRQSSVLNPDSLRDILLEGAQQAGSTRLAEVSVEYNLKKTMESISALKTDKHLIALDNIRPKLPLSSYWKNLQHKGTRVSGLILAIGSERGWTENELRLLEKSGFTLCGLGERILRTETAAISGSAICLAGMGAI